MDTIGKPTGAFDAPGRNQRLTFDQKDAKHGKKSKTESIIEESIDELKDCFDRSDHPQQSSWKRAYDSYNEATRWHKYHSADFAVEEDTAGEEGVLPPAAENALALPEEASEAHERRRVKTGAPGETERPENSSLKPEDKSGALTRRLVAATHQLEISDIIAEAFKELLNLRMSLGAGDSKYAGEIKRLITKMEKVVSRSFKKNRELSKEDSLRLKEQNAERLKEEARAKKIKAELRKKIKERKAREKKYLNEYEAEENKFDVSSSSQKLDAATEAQIAIQAEAIVSAESGGTGDMAGVISDGASAETVGGMQEGAATDAPAAEGGASVDVVI